MITNTPWELDRYYSSNNRDIIFFHHSILRVNMTKWCNKCPSMGKYWSLVMIKLLLHESKKAHWISWCIYNSGHLIHLQVRLSSLLRHQVIFNTKSTILVTSPYNSQQISEWKLILKLDFLMWKGVKSCQINIFFAPCNFWNYWTCSNHYTIAVIIVFEN